MRQIVEKLLALQKLELGAKPRTPEQEAQILKLRQQLPGPILGRFTRSIARGKKCVAIARRGACSECHLRLPSGTMAALAYTSEVHLCDNCGRYLYLPEDEPLGPAGPLPPIKASVQPSAKQTRQKADLHAA